MRRIAFLLLPLALTLTACPGEDDGGSDSGTNPPPPDGGIEIACGNGRIEAQEACDDGDTADGDGCSANCTVEDGWTCIGTTISTCTAICGDDQVVGNETCDDGNTTAGDGCSATCQIEPVNCGNGAIEGNEACDDNNTTNGDGCDESCIVEAGWMCTGEPSVCTTTCGDGIRAGAEACDDANTTTGDGCDGACAVEMGWSCAGMTPDVCLPICGDGDIIPPEECDDANTVSNDGCNGGCTVELGWTCTSTPSVCNTTCGDQIIAGAEECDDGNMDDGDTCETNCTLPICGNAIVDMSLMEACDDGNNFNGDGCDNNCTLPGCGNGIIDIGEACDDGNLIDGDGCESNCLTTFVCGNGTQELGEQCDDGNLAPRDGCSPLCRIEACGNNTIDVGEECDDGNLVNGDGCSSACLLEVVSGTNIVSAGFGGMRDIGVGTIDLQGVTGTVTRALLYWHGPTNLADSTANSTVTLDGMQVYGTNIGFSSDNCWGYQNSQAYRADVTNIVRGNGAHELADFFKAGANINGVSLIVFYDDGDPTNDSTVYLFDGNDSNIDNPYDGVNWNGHYANMLYTGTGTVTMELHVADGQAFPDEEVFLNGVSFIPAGPNFDGDSVPNGASAGNTSGGLWDIHRYPVTAFFTNTGTNTVDLTTTAVNNDCLSLITAVFIVPN